MADHDNNDQDNNDQDDTAKTRKAALPVRGFVLDGRYRLIEPIASGGNGQVWRGVQLSVDRLVAIKLLLPKHLKNKRERRRFEREAIYACRLSHPNLVMYYDHGYDEAHNLAFIVMELLSGRTISQELAVVRPMDVGRVCGIVEQICAGLSTAHEAGLIHRDIKPSNIMLIDGRTGQAGDLVKVLDFGLAKGFSSAVGADTPLTEEGFVLGTPHYLAPEQVRGLQLDARTDLYALACTAYHMLTGTRVFQGSNHFEVATQQAMEQPERLSSRYPEGNFPEPLEDLLSWSLSKEPEDRPNSVATFAKQFRLCVEAASKPWLHRVELPPEVRSKKGSTKVRPKRTPPMTFVQVDGRETPREVVAPEADVAPLSPEPKQESPGIEEPKQADTTPRQALVRLPLPDPQKAPGYKERTVATTPSMSVVKPHPRATLIRRRRWALVGFAVATLVSMGGGVGCLALLFL